MNTRFKILLIIVLFSCLFTYTLCAFIIYVEKDGTIQTTELSTVLLDDNDFLTKIQTLDSSITSVNKQNDLTQAFSINENVLNDSHIFSTTTSSVPTYLWIDNGTIYYFTIASTIDFNTNN